MNYFLFNIIYRFCSSDVSELSKTFPVVDMVFGNGQKLSLSPENYLFRVSNRLVHICFFTYIHTYITYPFLKCNKLLKSFLIGSALSGCSFVFLPLVICFIH